VTRETKKQRQQRFIEEFVRRLREAPAGERVYLGVGELFSPADVHSIGDLFSPADVHNIEELRAARRAAMTRNTTMRKKTPPGD
jgi:hypothetical protein